MRFKFLHRFIEFLGAILSLALLNLECAPAAMAETVPADTSIQIRLAQTLSSYGSKSHTPVRAIVIAPVKVDGKIVIPLGAEISGTVYDVRRVGLGFSRESAWIHLIFDSLHLPGGETIPIAGKITEVDNAREKIDEKDRIHGIRATASLASVLSGMAISVSALDPMLLAFGLSASLSTFRIPESEIVLPTGTEMHFKITEPVKLQASFPPAVAEKIHAGGGDPNKLFSFIGDLPFRTATATGNQPSDLTNLVFLGTEEALRSAFDAAGWVETDELGARSSYATMKSVVENQGYREAPMSTLLLDGQTPAITYSKTLNTFFKRHHLRVFAQDGTYDGRPVWTSSSTQDTGVGFAVSQKTFIHLIDENIDHERSKVVNDLVLTECVDAVELVDRPWVPLDASNATGDRLRTDGRVAVIQLNECTNPNRADQSIVDDADIATRPSAPLRATRNALLTLRNDLLRGNIVYQGYHGIKMGLGSLRGRKEESDKPRTANFGGLEWQIVQGPEKVEQIDQEVADAQHQRPTFQPLGDKPTNYETFLEFSASGGLSRFANERFSMQPINLYLTVENVGTFVTPVNAQTRMEQGWNMAFNATFNAHKHFSHELGFTLNQTELSVDMISLQQPPERIKGPADIRQFHYALLAHLRPNGARFRPYGAIGGGMQVIRLKEAVESGNALLKFAFKEANALVSAFTFGSTPPLEGGGIFQPTLHYGGGVKYHLTRRLVLRADFRETLSAQPDWWTKSHQSLRDLEFDSPDEWIEPLPVVKYGRLRHQRLSAGIGIAF